MLFSATPRIPVDEKSPLMAVAILARVWASAFIGFTPSTVVSIKQTSMLRLLCAASLCPARSAVVMPLAMAQRVISSPRLTACSCTSFMLKRTRASPSFP